MLSKLANFIEQTNNDIQTLESNKNSVDTFQCGLLIKAKNLWKYKQKFNDLNKNEYIQYKSIQQSLANFESSLKDLEAKIKEFEEN